MLRSFLLFILLLAGCAGISIDYRAMTPRASVSRDPASVAILTMTPPGLRYDVVGYFHAQAHDLDLEPGPALLAQIRDEAARRGCGAVLLDHGYCAETTPMGLGMTESMMDAACIEVQP